MSELGDGTRTPRESPQGTAVAVDLGTAAVTIARGSDHDTADITTIPFSADGWRDALIVALADVPDDTQNAAVYHVGIFPRSGRICLAVPDGWLDGSVAGVTAAEDTRHLVEDQLGLAPVTWAGQLAAVTAATVGEHGTGLYLLCDIGASQVRVAVTETDGTAVSTVAARATPGGWRDLDTALGTLLSADGRRLPADWHSQTEHRAGRARLVLDRAATDPDFADAAVYAIRDPGIVPASVTEIFPAELTECFTNVRERLAADVIAVTAGRRPDVVVLSGGGVGWFPLAATVISQAVGVTPKPAPPDAAARGALRFALGAMAPSATTPTASSPRLTIAVHRIYAGLLEAAEVTLRWTDSFTEFPGGPLDLEGDELVLTVNDRLVAVPLRGLPPGPHRIGIRRGWSGAATLVIKPADGGTPLITELDLTGAR
jgi:hypothetical protein